jgi:hypothetical protein
LLGHEDRALFNDEVIARLRGMLRDLACQLCQELAGAAGDREPLDGDDCDIAATTAELTKMPGLLAHLHAIVLEGQVSQDLQERLGTDPVVPPLLQALIGSPEPETAATAMKLLAAQARFMRYQQDMRMPLGELPGDLLHGALQLLPEIARRQTLAGATTQLADVAQAAIRASYDESTTRLGLIARLVTAMGGGAVAALALAHAGVAIFATALAVATGQDRDPCLLALQEGQATRLAVMLRASGIKLATVQASLLAAHPMSEPAAGELADTIARLPVDRATALLAGAAAGPDDWRSDWAHHDR